VSEERPEPEYLRLNRANWDDRAVAHAEHGGYDLQIYRDDSGHLSDVVRFDLPRLGDLTGVRGVHLQCHLGTDTLSLARLGARMTGVDLSERSLEYAARLAEDTGAEIDYHRADVYDAVDALGAERFDLVYTGIGALCWLPSIDRWAGVVAGLLRPGGRLFLLCFSDREPGEAGPRRVSRKEIEDAFAEGWEVESIQPSRFEVRTDLKDIRFSEGGPKALFSVIRRGD
jgi:SAM-dependent methyltransferase